MMQLTYCAISARLDRVAPFGRLSVPEVYMIWMGSSSATSTSGSSASSCTIQSATDSQPSTASPIAPRSRTVGGWSSIATAASATAHSTSSATMPIAPEWSSTKATSSAVSMKLIGTEITPRRARASQVTA